MCVNVNVTVGILFLLDSPLQRPNRTRMQCSAGKEREIDYKMCPDKWQQHTSKIEKKKKKRQRQLTKNKKKIFFISAVK